MVGGGGEGASLEYTPTWVVVVVFTVIVAISVIVTAILHSTGKNLVKYRRAALFKALFKIKEELLLLGFISLLLTVFQDRFSKICIPKHIWNHWLPCKKTEDVSTTHFVPKSTARFLAESAVARGHCYAKGMSPLLSPEALQDLRIFIFVLAVSHVLSSALTLLFGALKLKQWKHWEDSTQNEADDPEEVSKIKVDHGIMIDVFSKGIRATLFRWMKLFFKQFYGSVTRSDYITLRLGFILTRCGGNPNFNFHKYMRRIFEYNYKKVVGIRWYLWVIVIVFLLLNVDGWHAYFWISFVPLILLLAVGVKLERIQSHSATQIAEKHVAIEGSLVLMPPEDHYWFHRPQLLLHLIHIILFLNSFGIAIIFWMLATFGFDSCIMGQIGFLIPRLVIGVFVQFVCSYTTLPLYVFVTEMGSKVIFEDHVKEGLVRWAKRAQMKAATRVASHDQTQLSFSPSNLSHVVMVETDTEDDPARSDSLIERGKSPEI